ncbi:MAG: PAS-domain containing protein [Rhodobacteraceae bacterium]|nr:PAS-domain containing protein [Paracoccaceae bacterium]
MTPYLALAYGVAVAGSVVLAFGALLVASRFENRRHRLRDAVMSGTATETAFLFDDGDLLDASETGYAMLSAGSGAGSHLGQLSAILAPSFPTFDTALAALPDRHRITLISEDGQGSLTMEWIEGLVRVRLSDDGAVLSGSSRQTLRLMEEELSALRAISDRVPFVVWKQEADGRITWANRRYMDLVAEVYPDAEGTSWPLPRLFEVVTLTQPSPTGRVRRASLRIGAAPERWFEIASCALGTDVLFTAADADAVIKAEQTLRDFVQTLTKTFAHLTVGLAIFDKKRQLALFNPALTDLTQVQVDFLSRRPTLSSFLDKMREQRMIPEPRDYASWRRKLAELEAEAANGTYEEVWSLPTGQTFRVIGRPHPDGAVAFMFEDISAEVSLTRRFRAELEMGQAVIDSLPDAIAVFTSAGVLAMANAAYVRLWGHDPSTSLATLTAMDATALWASNCQPSPIWGEIRDFVQSYGDRATWDGDARMAGGATLSVRIVPLAGGSTLVGFSGPALDALPVTVATADPRLAQAASA